MLYLHDYKVCLSHICGGWFPGGCCLKSAFCGICHVRICVNPGMDVLAAEMSLKRQIASQEKVYRG